MAVPKPAAERVEEFVASVARGASRVPRGPGIRALLMMDRPGRRCAHADALDPEPEVRPLQPGPHEPPEMPGITAGPPEHRRQRLGGEVRTREFDLDAAGTPARTPQPLGQFIQQPADRQLDRLGPVGGSVEYTLNNERDLGPGPIDRFDPGPHRLIEPAEQFVAEPGRDRPAGEFEEFADVMDADLGEPAGRQGREAESRNGEGGDGRAHAGGREDTDLVGPEPGDGAGGGISRGDRGPHAESECCERGGDAVQTALLAAPCARTAGDVEQQSVGLGVT